MACQFEGTGGEQFKVGLKGLKVSKFIKFYQEGFMVEAKLYSISPSPPTFNSIEEERRHRKERLAAAFRVFAKFGFENGIAGHITVRDPEHPDLFLGE
jgi:hypothetical protein